MNKSLVFTILAVIIIGGIYYFVANSGSGGSPASSPETTSTVPSSNTSPTTSAAVNIQGFSFTPATLTVKVGTTVTWTNNDAVPHTITSDSGGLLASELIAPGQSFNHTFTTADTVTYHCNPHPAMKGTIIVTE